MVNRRSFLQAFSGFGAFGCGGVGYAKLLEPRWLRVQEVPVKLPGLSATKPIRIVQVSDLHASVVVPNELIEAAVETAIELKPDVICVTGDFVTHNTGYDPAWYERVLRRLALAAPTFGVLGNHDGGAWSRRTKGDATPERVANMVRRAGIRLLVNEPETIRVGGRSIEFVGLGDWSAEVFDPECAFAGPDAGLPRVVLSHNPDTKDYMTEWRWDLMLSGHTHGGQVVIPLVGSPWAPVEDKRYLEGLKPWEGRQIHVSRGVGSAGGIRLNCRPEINLLLAT